MSLTCCVTCLLLILSDNCKKTAVVLDGAIGTVEFINCQSVQCQVRWLFFCIWKCLQFFFLSFYFFALKSSYLQVFTNLYYLICIFSSCLIVFVNIWLSYRNGAKIDQVTSYFENLEVRYATHISKVSSPIAYRSLLGAYGTQIVSIIFARRFNQNWHV